MLETFKNLFKVPELRSKLLFTLAMILIYRAGAYIPTPGINPEALRQFFDEMSSTGSGGLFDMVDMFVGGAFQRVAIFALGIMPYISASIIIQLFGTVFPYFHKLQRDGADGRKKITQLTRYGTLLIAAIQALFIANWLQSIRTSTGLSAVLPSLSGVPFTILTIIALTTGTVFVMWLGEQITAKGIGNGISLLILVGIVAAFPSSVISEIRSVMEGTRHPFVEMIVVAIVLGMTAFIVWMYQATRKIPIQTPKKMVGSKMSEGQTTVLPLRLNMAGVIPIIFASSLMMIPGFLAEVFKNVEFVSEIGRVFKPGSAGYATLFAILIIFFTYFYTAIIFRPVDIAENLKRSGGFIPGIKPGKDTADYLQKILEYITLPGSIFLALIAVVPFILMGSLEVTFFFGGTSVLIVVGVALDTLQQIESHLQSRNYSGFMKKGVLKGRIG